MDSYITWPYQIADHNCMITWVYNKNPEQTAKPLRTILRAITCQLSEKDTRSQTCHKSKHTAKIRTKPCQKKDGTMLKQSEKDGAILKQCQNLSPVRNRWYNTQTVPKPFTSQEKMVQYSNRAKICQQSEKI